MSDFQTRNPYNQKIIHSYNYHTKLETQRAVEKLVIQQKKWKRLSLLERAQILEALSHKLELNKSTLAEVASQEMGKPIVQSILEVEKCILGLRLFLDLTKNTVTELKIDGNYKNTSLHRQPYGIILSIQPWNFPYWQVFRMAAAAWMAGNLIILKHSEVTAGCAELIENMCQINEFNLLANLRLTHDDTAELIKSSAIQMVTLTGSTRAGQQVGAVAGAALKKTLFELGGSDAYIVMPDCDLQLAVKSCVRSRLTNSGQSCIAAKRFYVHEEIYNEFKTMFLDEMKSYKVGDPSQPDTQIGPLAQSQFVQMINQQIEKAQINHNAIFEKINLPHDLSTDSFSPVGVLEFGKDLVAFQNEEIFGPIASFYSFTDVEKVVEAVNAGPYGLGGAIFTANLNLAQVMASEMDVGMFSINSALQSDARVPFGGRKNSGIGRESGLLGLDEFTSWKTVGYNS